MQRALCGPETCPRRRVAAQERPNVCQQVAWSTHKRRQTFRIFGTVSKRGFSVSMKTKCLRFSKFRARSRSPGFARQGARSVVVRFDGTAGLEKKENNSSNGSAGEMQACRHGVVSHIRDCEMNDCLLLSSSVISALVSTYAIGNSTAELGVHGRTYEANPCDAHAPFSRLRRRVAPRVQSCWTCVGDETFGGSTLWCCSIVPVINIQLAECHVRVEPDKHPPRS